MVARFKNIWKDEVVDWAIVIGDALLEVDAGPEGFALKYTPEGRDLDSVIFSSQVTFSVFCVSTEQKEFVNGLGATFASTTIRIEKNGNLFWAGQMLGEGIKIDQDNFGGIWYQIEATDALETLKDVWYENGAQQYSGTERLLGHVKKCLSRLNYVQETWGEGGIPFFKTANNWKAAQHGANDDPMYKTWANQRVWYDFDARGTIKKTSCYDVIKQCVGSLGCRIWQFDGAWLVEQPTQQAQANLPAWAYEYSLAAGTATTLQGTEPLECDSPTARITGAYMDFLSPLRSATYKWKARQRRNWAPGYYRNDSTNLPGEFEGDNVQHSTGNVAFRVQAKVRVRLDNTGGYTGTGDMWVKFRLRIRVGDYYLERSYVYANGGFQAGPVGGWGLNTPALYDFGSPILPSPVVVSNFQASFSLNFLTPTLPAGSGQFKFGIFYDGVYEIPSGNTAFGITPRWEFYDVVVEAFYSGSPINTSDLIEYEQKNPSSDFGEALEFESLLGDQGTINDLGGLFAGSPTTPSTLWVAGGIGGSQKLGALWAQQQVRARKTVRNRLYATLHGRPFPLYYLLEYEGKKWIFIGGTYTSRQDKVQGTWMELQVPTDGMVITVTEKQDDPTFLNGRPFLDDSGGGSPALPTPFWRVWRGTVNESGHCVLNTTTHKLPSDPDLLIVTVESLVYDTQQFGRTYTLNLQENRLEFSDDQLNGLSVKITRLA